MSLLEAALITGFICCLICVLAYWKKIFELTGLVSAFAVGFIIGTMGHVSWLFILFVFMVTGFIATKYKFSYKAERGIQEGKKGERTYKSVLATGLVPTVVAVLNAFPNPYLRAEWTGVLFLTAVGVAAADTLASELGMLSSKTYLITTLKPVRPGTDGGISLFGEVWALCASAYVAVIGWIILSQFSSTVPNSFSCTLIPTLGGFLGCQIDSLLGATLERKGFIGKHGVNLASSVLTVGIVWLVLIWL